MPEVTPGGGGGLLKKKNYKLHQLTHWVAYIMAVFIICFQINQV